jgi:hypothetical protein
MPGGGLFALVSYGTQNVILNSNPDITYFYKTFRKYSHYSEESVTTAMNGPNELGTSAPVQVRLKLQRVADLVRDMYFVFRIPDIYSKYIADRQSQYNFSWVRYLGAAIIQSAAVFIGGQKIQEIDGTYILSHALLDYDQETFQKWQRLVGDVPELNNPALGIYGGGSETVGYPTVYPDPSGAAARPSIFGRDIYVPLPFWFTESTYSALPLVALQGQDVEIQIVLRPVESLYRILDASGNKVRPGYRLDYMTDVNSPVYTSDEDDKMNIRHFLTDFIESAPALNTWFFDPRLTTTYIYLTDEERKAFVSKELQYTIRQISPFHFSAQMNRQQFQLDITNPITRLIAVPRRTDAMPYRNDWSNMTNWIQSTAPPYIKTPGIDPWIVNIYATGRLIPQGQRDIIRNLRLLGDGNELQEEKRAEYYKLITPWKYASGGASQTVTPVNFAGRLGVEENPLLIPFSMTSPEFQPNGSINASRIKKFQVEVDFWPLPLEPEYLYDLSIYAETINWVIIVGGTGGLKYAL